MIEHLDLKNFAAFQDLEVNLSSKINVIIGESGTGKTQLLKALYFANKSLAKQNVTSDDLLRLFRPLDNSLKGLVGEDGKSKAELICKYASGQILHVGFSANSKHLAEEKFVCTPAIGVPNFIPVKEVLSLMKGMLDGHSCAETLKSVFDQSYLDIAQNLARKPPKSCVERIDNDPRFSAIFLMLVKILGGRFDVVTKSDLVLVTFQSGKYERVKDSNSENYNKMTFRGKRRDSADMTAEGLRKLGILQLLLENQTLAPGQSGIFLWDEPEANLNPKFMNLIVKLLLEIARNGQQVVIATHDYVMLKWFDLLMDEEKDDHIRFHSLYRDPNTSQIKISSTDDYLNITPNPIDEAFGFLIDQEIEKDMGGLGK